ncbi:MAG: FAD-dependent oxidoreductase [Schumannella sp.]|nr:oxidoreductase [Microbacteriaceae bacterium]
MIGWLDRILGRVTMYGLVVISLGILQLVALVVSAFGTFGFGPLELVASSLVLVAASYLANRLAGLIVRIQPQTTSAIITGQLLSFIFWPTLDPAGLGILAVAAVVATATKYLIAVRGRHLLNPAAAGAFLTALIPWPVASTFVVWWPGTTILLPFVTIAALAILFRTRKLWLGLVFVLVATLTWGITFLRGAGIDAGPDDFVQGVSFAILGYPTIFLAGFMLSEPLTLPPRRWQQVLEAILVGILFGLPFVVFGLFSSSPQFALLVGNLLAFFFGQHRGIRLRFLGKSQLAPTSWEFEFEALRPVHFTPGQFMELTLPHRGTDSRGWRRVFSIASAPGDGSRVRFGVRLPERSSSFKKALLGLEPGTTLSATSVGGDFVLPRDDSPVLLVAGGIGITPYVSQLEDRAEHAADGEPVRDVALVYAISTPDDLAYAKRLAKTGCSSVTVVCATRPTGLPKAWRWLESTRLTGEQLLEAVPDARERHAYLSGTPAMVTALKRALHRAGVHRIHTDVFVGY